VWRFFEPLSINVENIVAESELLVLVNSEGVKWPVYTRTENESVNEYANKTIFPSNKIGILNHRACFSNAT
jgi:hypothetical protein